MDNSRRTASRDGWSDGVRIRELGTPGGNRNGYSAEAFPPQSGGVQGNSSRAQRRNSPFLAAWILTGILIGVGFLWMGGVFENSAPVSYAYTASVDPATGLPVQPQSRPLEVQLRNLGFIAPFTLLIGLASASALLALQGIRKSQTLPASAPGQEPQQG